MGTEIRGRILEVFLTFLKLGCVSFGGPVAHLGYYQQELVEKRKWLTEDDYAGLVALCQFLPGPSSSQIGFAIGKLRGGLPGAFAAWIGFTLPSAVLMIGFALGMANMGSILSTGFLSGLKLAAVAVVANAVWSMGTKLCTDRIRLTIALIGACLLLLLSLPILQIVVIVCGAIIGLIALKGESRATSAKQISTNSNGSVFGTVCLVVFFGLLLSLPLISHSSEEHGWLAMVDSFYRSGSLVFGGGHVVLPLLERETVMQGLIAQDTFLAGYGAAQALPGPLFAFSAFLGTGMSIGPGGISGGLLALLSIYLPAWLLVLGILPFWGQVSRWPGASAALAGTNAAVVGLLLAALYDPIIVSSIGGGEEAAFALCAFLLLRIWRCPPWLLVVGSALVGAAVL